MLFPHGGAATIFRDMDGADAHNPDKAEIRDWGGAVEDAIVMETSTTQSWISGAALLPLQDVIVTTGYSSRGDGGGGLWRRVSSEPVHQAKRQFTDGLQAAWYELIGTVMDPRMMGAANDGQVDDIVPMNATARRACQLRVTWVTNGPYYISASLHPGGRLRWESGETRVIVKNSDFANFNPVYHNPDGTTQHQPSSKRVIVDTGRLPENNFAANTAGMEKSVHSGRLIIEGTSVANMRQINKLVILNDLVGMAAGQGISPSISWDSLSFRYVNHAFWQGDHRGTGQRNLSYTGMSIISLEEFMCGPIVGGQGGNFFDDVTIQNWRRFRGTGVSIFRVTSLKVLNFFNNGLNQSVTNPSSNDEELETVSMAFGSNFTTLSGPNPNIVVGSTLAIADAAVNLDGDPVYLVAEVTDVGVNGLDLTLDFECQNPSGVTGAKILVDPPEMRMETGAFNMYEVYHEEIHAKAMVMGARATLGPCVLRLSSGVMCGMYQSGMLFWSTGGGTNHNSAGDIMLHNRSANVGGLKYAVGVFSLMDGSSKKSSCSLRIQTSYPRDEFTKSRPIGIVTARPADLLGVMTDISDRHNGNLNLVTLYGDKEVTSQRIAPGRDAFSRGQDGNVKYAPLFDIGDATNVVGTMSQGSGTMSKASGGSGSFDWAITSAAHDRVKFDFGFSSFTAGAPKIRFIASGTILQEVQFADRDARESPVLDVPAGTTKVTILDDGTNAWVMNEAAVYAVIDR